MPILAILSVCALLAMVFGPSLWAKWTLSRHGDDRPDFPGTGGELARHLLDEAGLHDVRVETVPQGDHYSPDEKAVRLEPQHHNGRSLTAVAVAAHEVGHALQDQAGYGPLETRSRLIKSTAVFQKIGSAVVFASPVLGLVVRSPGLMIFTIVVGILTMAVQVVVHAATLPVEYDASFKRALPVLEAGGYLHPNDLPAARQILKACALTYVAGALSSLLNLFQWIRYLR